MYLQKILLTITLLFFTACGGGDSASTKVGETTPNPDNADFSDTFSYKSSTPYKSVLIECAGATQINTSCSLQKLPFLVQENSTVTKESIMNRVVVSHEWMGKRFEEMLDILPSDILTLLGSVTAIVIDDDIIPSYYWGLTGSIYLDPRYLWLTPQEAATITQKEDFRSSFSNGLQFIIAARLTYNSNYATTYYSLNDNITRTKNDILLNLASLLYHELAHANDLFPPELRNNINPNDSVLDALNSIYSQNISNQLYATYPLTSNTLAQMGQVIYKGETATNEQKATTATDMGTLFTQDNAARMYAYSTPLEDTATLFENTMMKLHYGIEQDFAFIKTPTKTEGLVYTDYIVKWGARNIVAREDVQRRALFVTKKFFPEINNWDTIFNDNIGTYKLLNTEVAWYTALQINKASNKPLQNNKLEKQNKNVRASDFYLPPL